MVLASGLLFHSCRNEIVQFLPGGERNSKDWFEPIPYGMVYIPRGSYVMGPSDDESLNPANSSRRVTVESFWMDDTEITNNEYRQFVYWVRDSIARRTLGESYPEYLVTENHRGEPLDVPVLNWNEKIDWRDAEYQLALNDMYIPEEERLAFSKEIDSRKLIYEFSWVDYKQAARRKNSYNFEKRQYEGTVLNQQGENSQLQTAAHSSCVNWCRYIPIPWFGYVTLPIPTTTPIP
jgi:formylglycine-generating enzyme